MPMTLLYNVDFVDNFGAHIISLNRAVKGLKGFMADSSDLYNLSIESLKLRSTTNEQYAAVYEDITNMATCFSALQANTRKLRRAGVDLSSGIAAINVKTTVCKSTGRFVYRNDPANFLQLHKTLRGNFLKGAGVVEVDATAQDATTAAILAGDNEYLAVYKAGGDPYTIQGHDRNIVKFAANKMINGGGVYGETEEFKAAYNAFLGRFPVLGGYVRGLTKYYKSPTEIVLFDGNSCTFEDCEQPTQCASRVIQANGAAVLRLILADCNAANIPIYGHLHDAVYTKKEYAAQVAELYAARGFNTKFKAFD